MAYFDTISSNVMSLNHFMLANLFLSPYSIELLPNNRGFRIRIGNSKIKMLGVASKFAPQARTALVQSSRNMTVVSAPPSNRVSWAEKVCHGLAITAGMIVVPAWVLVNIKHYKARD